MFAHKEDDPDFAQLPGWAELGGSSVLLNGTPIAGNYDRNQDQSVAWIGVGAGFKSPPPQ